MERDGGDLCSLHYENDTNGGKMLYHIDPVIIEFGKKADMKISCIVAHTQNSENTLQGQLMRDLKAKNPDDIVNPILRKRVEYFKKGKGKEIMCQIMREIEERGKAEGLVEGAMKKAVEIATNMLHNFHSNYEFVQQCTGLSLEQIKMIDANEDL